MQSIVSHANEYFRYCNVRRDHAEPMGVALPNGCGLVRDEKSRLVYARQQATTILRHIASNENQLYFDEAVLNPSPGQLVKVQRHAAALIRLPF